MCNRPYTKTCFSIEGYFDLFCATNRGPCAKTQKPFQPFKPFAAFQPPLFVAFLIYTNPEHWLYQVDLTAHLSDCKENSLFCVWVRAAWLYSSLFQWLLLCFALKEGRVNPFVRTSQANPLFLSPPVCPEVPFQH